MDENLKMIDQDIVRRQKIIKLDFENHENFNDYSDCFDWAGEWELYYQTVRHCGSDIIDQWIFDIGFYNTDNILCIRVGDIIDAIRRGYRKQNAVIDWAEAKENEEALEQLKRKTQRA